MKRNTIQQQLILNAVKELDMHATAEQVHDHIVKANPSISKATVYRNLAQMASDGALLNAGNANGATHYDHNVHKHYHFFCSRCKKVIDVQGDFPDILALLNKSDEYQATSCNVSFTGLCAGCKTS